MSQSGYFATGYFDVGYFPEGWWPDPFGEAGEYTGVAVATIPTPFCDVEGAVGEEYVFPVGGWVPLRPLWQRPAPVTGTVAATCPQTYAHGVGVYEKFSDEQIEEIIAALLMAA